MRSLSKSIATRGRMKERRNLVLAKRRARVASRRTQVHRVGDDYGKEGRSAARERSRGTMIFDLCASWAAGRKRNYCNQDLFRALYCHNTADLPAVISQARPGPSRTLSTSSLDKSPLLNGRGEGRGPVSPKAMAII